MRACPCPQLPIGFYWFGGNRHSIGGVPRWVERLLQRGAIQDMGELTQSNATQHVDDVIRDNLETDNNSDSQLLDDVIRDDQKTEAHRDDQLPAELESHGKATANQGVDQLCSLNLRYNLRDPYQETTFHIQIRHHVRDKLLP